MMIGIREDLLYELIYIADVQVGESGARVEETPFEAGGQEMAVQALIVFHPGVLAVGRSLVGTARHFNRDASICKHPIQLEPIN